MSFYKEKYLDLKEKNKIKKNDSEIITNTHHTNSNTNNLAIEIDSIKKENEKLTKKINHLQVN